MADSFGVQLEVTAKAIGRRRNEVDVAIASAADRPTFSFATDERREHGGEGTAPPPLAMFSASLVACLMTQIRSFARKSRIDLDRLVVRAAADWSAEVRDGGWYEATAGAIVIDIEIDSPSPHETNVDLIHRGRRGCFVEQALRPGLVKHRMVSGDAVFALD